MKLLNKISDVLDRIAGVAIVILMAALLVVVMMQIIWRTWLTAISWTDEALRYLLIWATYLGATSVYRHSGNIAINALQDAMPAKIRKGLRVFVHALCLVLFIVLCCYGVKYCGGLKKSTTTLPVKMNMRYIYCVMPISLAVMAYHAAVMILNEITGYGKEVKA